MNKIKQALKHKYLLGEGAKKRNKLNLNKEEEFSVISQEFERGTLMSGSGSKVKNRKQALAIAINELKKRGKY